MYFERIEDNDLSHYSYIVGCQKNGEVAVVDPRRDVDVYIDWAERNGATIAHVLETHIHADFASGAKELAERSGAVHRVSAYDSGEIFEVGYGHEDMLDGEELRIGNVRIVAMHTPGHTPEHLSFLVYDGARSFEVPMLFLTGDFLFVGSLGRPDLLGEEAKLGLAHQKYDSVQKLADLPDGLEIHPAHGSGSMCGAGMSGRPSSTLGFERIANPYLRPGLDRETFVAELLGNVPPFPEYYKRMKRLNSDGPATLGEHMPGTQRPLTAEEAKEAIEEGAVVLDLRDQLSFGGGHVPDSYGIGLGKLSMWASWVLPYETPILLVADDDAHVEEASRRLVRVGLDDVIGYIKGGIESWTSEGGETAELPQISPQELAAQLSEGEITVLDVRGVDEYAAGHVDGAVNIIGGELRSRLAELPNGGSPVAVMCRSGYRSTVAGSVLQQEGWTNVMNVTGGFQAWNKAGLPVSQ